MFLSKSEKLQVWNDALKGITTLKSQLPIGSKLASLFNLLNSTSQLARFYEGSDWTAGKHCFSLHDNGGQKRQVLIDDYIPAVVVEGSAVPAFLRPVEYEGKLYLLGSL